MPHYHGVGLEINLGGKFRHIVQWFDAADFFDSPGWMKNVPYKLGSLSGPLFSAVQYMLHYNPIVPGNPGDSLHILHALERQALFRILVAGQTQAVLNDVESHISSFSLGIKSNGLIFLAEFTETQSLFFVAFFLPWIRTVAVPVGFVIPGFILDGKFDTLNPLDAFIKIAVRHQGTQGRPVGPGKRLP